MMGDTSKIEWTDRTWTPVVGCDPVSPACANCYAALMAARLEAMGQPKYSGIATRNGNRGKWTGKVTLWEPELMAPMKVKKPQTWFLTSMGDVGHERVPFGFLDRMFAVMTLCPQHTFYVLTKRPGRLAEHLTSRCVGDIEVSAMEHGIGSFDDLPPWPLPNVLIGCTAEDQPRADERRPAMASIAAAGWRTFVSYEPALGPVDWSGWEFLSWLISGGESGQHARPSHPDWHRSAQDWCACTGVSFLFKQWGEWSPLGEAERERLVCRCGWSGVWGGAGHDSLQEHAKDCPAKPLACSSPPVTVMRRVGKKASGRLLDGVEHNAFPESQ